ncbi:MAG TPA: hypothetical protein VFN97_15390 [Actinospica sp.]|nr:hypothetical protein [Actinospica sp.]
MGSHAKPRTTGRRAALGALALGASLSGVGLIAAALDPSTAVLTATGADGEGGTQLSGLSSPVGLDLNPTADTIANLSAAPVPSAAATAAPALRQIPRGEQSSADSVDWFSKPTRPATSSGGSSGTSGSHSGSGSTPVVSPNPTKTTGSGGSGTHKVTGSGNPPTGTSGITTAVQDAVAPVTSTVSQVVPAVRSLVGQMPVVSTLVQDTGVANTVSSLPLVGSLLGGSGDGQSAVTVPGVSTVAGLL